jgi:ferredoxin
MTHLDPPLEKRDMAYTINDKCVKCGTCADTCPVEAISEGDETYEIDADKCVECGACAGSCPVEAIEAP